MFWSTTSDYQYPFETVTLAIFSKYPNPFASHVESCDVIERTLKDGILTTTRLFKKTGKLPSWVTWISMRNAYVLEKSVVDLRKKRMVVETRNLSHSKMMLVKETQIITDSSIAGGGALDSTSPDGTSASSSSNDAIRNSVSNFGTGSTRIKINVSIVSNTSFAPIRSRIEDWGIDRFRKNTVNVSYCFNYSLPMDCCMFYRD
jgi:PRELI-like family